MELVYKVTGGDDSVYKDPTCQGNDTINRDCVCCSLSSRNILAFSMFMVDSKQSYWKQCQVYVCDLDNPWNAFLVTSSSCEVVAIKWNLNSERLLIADTNGRCQLWVMEENMLNKWTKGGEIELNGEYILAMSWFSNGISICLNVDKKDSPSYSEKFSTVVTTPTLSHFGGRALDGFLVVTATGLVSAAIFEPMETDLQICHSSLGPTHTRFALADVCHTKDNHMMVATSDGHTSSLIRCYLVSIASQRSFQINSKPASSFYVKGNGGEGRVTHLSFTGAGNTDTLLVAVTSAASSTTTSCIEVWHLLEQNILLHNAFLNCPPGHAKDSKFKMVKWMHKESVVTETGALAAISPSRLRLGRVGPEFACGSGSVTSFASAVYHDGTVKLIQPHTGQVLTSMRLNEWTNDSSCPHTVSAQTMSGLGLVLLNRSGIWLYRMVNDRDQPMYVSPSQLVMLIEYCVIAGFDSWDVMLAVKQGMGESMVQKLMDTFHKQPPSVQDRMYMRLLGAKMTIYQMSGASGRLRAVDVQAQIVLSGIAIAFNQTLRPITVTSHSMSPSECLLAIMDRGVETDMDKIILLLDSQDFIVDPGILVSLQHLIQWLANFTVLLLLSVPHLASQLDLPGATLLKDASLLQTLRVQLIIVRIWSIIHRPCEPKFLTSTNLDCLYLLFSLLTRVWFCTRDGSEMDDALLDECAMLPSKIFMPSLEHAYMANTHSTFLYTQALPVAITLHEQPDFVVDESSFQIFIPDVAYDSKQKRDMIHQTGLGACLAEGVKQCVRCGCMTASLANSPKAKVLSTAMRAWEMRWSKSCFCTGFWKYTPAVKT